MPSSFREEAFNYFPLYEYVKQVTPAAGHFLSRAIVLTILIEAHKIKPYTKYQRPGPSSFSQAEFSSFIVVYVKILPFRKKKVKVNLRLYFLQTLLGSCPLCCIPSPSANGPLVPEEKILKCFYHIWAWRLSWSCDLDAANKFSFSRLTEVPYKIWLWSAQWFLWRRRLKSVYDRRTDDGVCLYYKLTYEPKGSDELIKLEKKTDIVSY